MCIRDRKYIHGTYQEAELPELGEGEAIDTSIPADPNVKNYSYAIVEMCIRDRLLPSHDAVSLITVLPEQLQSPLLTAEWEYRLGEIERGQLAPEEFLDGISIMLKDLVGTYQVIKGTEYLFTPPREVVGKCPRCGGEVAELLSLIHISFWC